MPHEGNDELIADIRSEANIADRPGSFDRLNAIADRVSTALRTEQSARQAAEAMWDDALKSGRKWQEKADDMQARIDAALAVNEDRKQDKHRRIRDALTESKEPDMHDPKNNAGLNPGSEW